MLRDVLERLDKVNVNSKKIQLLAVTKKRTIEEIKPLLDAGITIIGENRVQEAQEKWPMLADYTVQKHIIGPLQSNKENKALELCDVIQSIESLEQLQRLSVKLKNKQMTKKIYIQFNSALEDTKHGLREQDDAYPLIDFILSDSVFELEGLMTIGALSEDEKTVRQSFARLAKIRENIISKYNLLYDLKLSMGMSNDFEWAIQEGSDMVRLGSILFAEQ